jgi:hypothetical protein
MNKNKLNKILEKILRLAEESCMCLGLVHLVLPLKCNKMYEFFLFFLFIMIIFLKEIFISKKASKN